MVYHCTTVIEASKNILLEPVTSILYEDRRISSSFSPFTVSGRLKVLAFCFSFQFKDDTGYDQPSSQRFRRDNSLAELSESDAAYEYPGASKREKKSEVHAIDRVVPLSPRPRPGPTSTF